METQEQASKESAPKRMYHRMIAHEGAGPKRPRGEKVTALQSRRVRCVCVCGRQRLV